MSPALVFLKVLVRLTIMVSPDTGWILRYAISCRGINRLAGRSQWLRRTWCPREELYPALQNLCPVPSLALAKYIKAFQTPASFFTSFPSQAASRRDFRSRGIQPWG